MGSPHAREEYNKLLRRYMESNDLLEMEMLSARMDTISAGEDYHKLEFRSHSYDEYSSVYNSMIESHKRYLDAKRRLDLERRVSELESSRY